MRFFQDRDDEELYEMCYFLDQVYTREKLGLKIFNAYLKDYSCFSEIVTVFTGTQPQLESIEKLPSFMSRVYLMKNIYEKTKTLFSTPSLFATIIADIKLWKTNKPMDGSVEARSIEADAEAICVELNKFCSKNKNIYCNQSNLLPELDIRSYAAFKVAVSNIIDYPIDYCFLTNLPLSNAGVNKLLSGNVEIITAGCDDKIVRKHLTVTRDRVSVHDSSAHFLISKKAFLNLVR